jgi:glyoxylase-like metal-dependent hydrolase (beta-lactamase superfamily II)
MKVTATLAGGVWLWLCLPGCGSAQPILEAASKGKLAEVRDLLVDRPDQIAVTSESGKTALHFAAQGGHAELVGFLISKGAQVDVGNVIGETPLHYAAAMGQVEAVKGLLGHHAKTTTTNVDRNTPLHYAAYGGRPEVARALLEGGAEVNAPNHYGYTPLDLALANGQQELAQFLASAGGKQIPIQAPEVALLSGSVSRVLFPFGDVSNIAVSSSDEGFLLVDTGFTPRALGELRKALRDLGSGEVRYVINTHKHGDHIAGNGIGGDEAVLIDLDSLDRLASQGVLRRRNDEAFGSCFTLTFGGEEVRLIPYPGIHTDDDLIVHFTRSGVVHMGDLLIPQSFPSITRKVDDYLSFLDKVASGFPETTIFVAGHGPETTRAEVAGYRAMLAGAAAIIRQQLEQGRTTREIRESEALRPYQKWGESIPVLSSSYWVDAVYNTSKEMP